MADHERCRRLVRGVNSAWRRCRYLSWKRPITGSRSPTAAQPEASTSSEIAASAWCRARSASAGGQPWTSFRDHAAVRLAQHDRRRVVGALDRERHHDRARIAGQRRPAAEVAVLAGQNAQTARRRVTTPRRRQMTGQPDAACPFAGPGLADAPLDKLVCTELYEFNLG